MLLSCLRKCSEPSYKCKFGGEFGQRSFCLCFQGMFIASGCSGDYGHSTGGIALAANTLLSKLLGVFIADEWNSVISSSTTPMHVAACTLAFDVEYGLTSTSATSTTCAWCSPWAQMYDGDLRVLVDAVMSHHDQAFRLKSAAMRGDVFHVISGMWLSPAERSSCAGRVPTVGVAGRSLVVGATPSASPSSAAGGQTTPHRAALRPLLPCTPPASHSPALATMFGRRRPPSSHAAGNHAVQPTLSCSS